MFFAPKVGITFTVTHPTYPGPKRFKIIAQAEHGWTVMNLDTGMDWEVDAKWFDPDTKRKFKEIATNGKPTEVDRATDQPEWMTQWELTQSGEKKWDDFSFEERTCKGWLIPYLLEIETQMCGRWMWWTDVIEAGKLPDTPIPQIKFTPEGFGHYAALPKQKKAKASEYDPVKMLLACMDHYSCHSVRLPDFFEWILWGLGANEKRANADAKVNEHWYRTFNLGLLLKYPHDYLGDML